MKTLLSGELRSTTNRSKCDAKRTDRDTANKSAAGNARVNNRNVLRELRLEDAVEAGRAAERNDAVRVCQARIHAHIAAALKGCP